MAYTLEETPTWAVAAVCTLIVLVSLIVERLINLVGKMLKEKKQKPLFEALEKMKGELMIMGFISLLLTVFQTSITSLCMPEDWAPFMLPCPYVPRSEDAGAAAPELAAPPAGGRHNPATPPAVHSRRRLLEWGAQKLVHNESINVAIAGGRKLLARIERRLNEAGPVKCPVFAGGNSLKPNFAYTCATSDKKKTGLQFLVESFNGDSLQLHWLIPAFIFHFGDDGLWGAYGKVPIISLEGLHQLHIFIFVMTVVHVVYCCATVFLGFYKMHGWKKWEEETRAVGYDHTSALRETFKMDRTKTFIAAHKAHPLSSKSIQSWIISFFRQFGVAVEKSDYLTLRIGFISTHNLSPTFDFHSYMRRSMEDDFKVVVGISASLWVFVIIFLLLNVDRWLTYFWIAFLPVLMILVIGTKLQHIIQQLSVETAQLHEVIGEVHVKARDSLFWFSKPQILIIVIHFILFQNAFELAFFFWILTTFGFDSCVLGKSVMVIVRLVLGTAVQILCSYSTLPLYALVTQMGTYYKKAIFQDKTAEAIHGWHHTAKQNRKKINKDGGSMTREKLVRGSMKLDSEDSMRSCEFSVTESSRSLQLSKSNLERFSDVQDPARGTDSPGGGSSPHRTRANIVEDESTVGGFAPEVSDPTCPSTGSQRLT